MGCGKEGQREEEARSPSLVDERRRRPVVVGSWEGHWEWCMNNSYHG
jgi:hypothetical protein